MQQLPLFDAGLQISIRITPQPIPTYGYLGMGWQWYYRAGCSIVMTNPEKSESLPDRGPYRVGQFFGRHVIDRVEVRQTQSRGWVWVLHLRDVGGEDMEAFWTILAPKTPQIYCEECRRLCCEEDEDPLQPAVLDPYHYFPKEAVADDPTLPLLLCRDCANGFREYWTRQWTRYYRDVA